MMFIYGYYLPRAANDDEDDMDMEGFGFDSEPVDEENEMDIAFVDGEVSERTKFPKKHPLTIHISSRDLRTSPRTSNGAGIRHPR